MTSAADGPSLPAGSTVPSRWWTIVPVVLLALAVGATVVFVDEILQRRAAEAQQARLVLTSAAADLGRLDVLPWDMLRPDLAPSVPAEFGRQQMRLLARLEELDTLHTVDPHEDRLVAETRVDVAALVQVIALLQAGNLNEASRVSATRVEPASERLSDDLARADRTLEQDARWADHISFVGSIAVIAVALGLFGVLLYRTRRASIRANEANAHAIAAATQYRLLFDENPNPMWVIERDTYRFLAVNEAAIEHYGYTQDEFLSMSVLDIRPPEDIPVIQRKMNEQLVRYRSRHVKHDGTMIDVEVTASDVEFGESKARVVLAVDITEQLRAEARIHRQLEINRHQAQHDALTGLPNRTQFARVTTHALNAANHDGARVAVLLMDLDGFKKVNDTLGHAAGDELLVQLGRRLAGVTREGDTVARLGGDEFGVVIRSTSDPSGDGEAVAQRIAEVLEEPFSIDSVTVSVEASIGVAHFPDHGEDVDALLKHADVAMYVAKTRGFHWSVYSTDSDRCDVRELGLLGELRRAMDQHQLILEYQPQVVAGTSDIAAVEALVRWQHPTRGLLMPNRFMPLVEHSGLVTPFTLYVLEEALQQATEWRAEGLALDVAVNLSARNLGDPEFARAVDQLIKKYDPPAGSIVFELTESAIMSEPQTADEVLSAFDRLGIRVSLDDYGTGYSSLAFLNRCWLSQVKIDRRFVFDLVDVPAHQAIAGSIIALGHRLDLDVVAEGVETEEVWETLSQLGCDLGQGFHLARPGPASLVAELVNACHSRTRRPLALTA